jgi:hypothetical protein
MQFLALLLIGTLLFAGVDRTLPYPTKIDAGEIAKQVYFVNHQLYLDNQLLKASKTHSILIVRRAKGKKPRVLRAERYLNNDYSDGITKSKDLVIFISGNLKGTGVLAREFMDEEKSLEILMWLPALRKVRRMAEPSKNMGYSAADVAFMEEAKLRRLSEDKYELLETRTMDFEFGQIELKPSELDRFSKLLPQKKHSLKAEVYLLKATPEENAWYDYRIDYVDTKHFTAYRTDFYKEDKPIKTIDRQWVKVKGIDDPRAYMWNYWYSINPETKFVTVNYIPDEIIQSNDKHISSTFWSESTLSKIKR